MFQVKVIVKEAVGKPCPKFKVGDRWVVNHAIVTPGMCAQAAIGIIQIMEVMLHSPERPVMEWSCPGCNNTDCVMIYQIQNMHPDKPPEKLVEFDVVPIVPIA
jgi:uncharacterized repeat protein (TIGR04076 family)